MRSRQELLEASGYANRPRDFDDLIHILDRELRLITPTDPEGSEASDESVRHLPERAILPAHPRLPGSLPAGLADPQADGKLAGAGRSCGWRNAQACGTPSQRTAICRPSGNGSASARSPIASAGPITAAGHDVQRASRFHRSRLTIAAVLVGLITAWSRRPGIVSIGTSASCSRRKPGSRKRPASKGSSVAW